MKQQSDVFEYHLIIREHDLDTFGHVNNATYFTLFEEARWDFLTSNGYGLKEVQERKIGPVVLEVDAKFKKEVKNREKITIKSYCHQYVGKVGKVDQKMVNAKGEEVCTATFVFGLFDLHTRKLILPTPEWLKAVGMDD